MRGALHAAQCTSPTGRPNPTSAGCYSRTMLKLSMSKLSLFKLGAWSLTWRERPAWKHGHWEHLDVTHETADSARGKCPKFSTSGHVPKSAPSTQYPALS